MQPARIRVFDGLRITTEHLEHLQEGVHSAVGDLREALGLGRVQYGFQVEPQGDVAIVVGPGLAFDRQRERIVSDEPIRVAVAFEPGQDALYVVAGHRAVEEGEVEGRTTIVWDSCEIQTVAARPAPTDNVVTLARLVPRIGPTGPTFEIAPVDSIEAPAEASGQPVEQPADAETAPTGGAVLTTNGSPAPTQPVTLAPGTMRARQGVVRLSGAAGTETGGGGALEAALRARLAPAAGEAALDPQRDPIIELAVADLSLGFAPLTVTAHLRLSAALAAPIATSTPATDGGPAAEPAPTATAHRWEATGQGEATIEGGTVPQFGWLTIHGPTSAPAPMPASAAVAEATATTTWIAKPRFSERGMAELPLGPAAEATASDSTTSLLSHVSLVVDASPTATADLRLRCQLAWTGSIDESLIQAVHERWSAFEWQLLLAWKAVGVQR